MTSRSTCNVSSRPHRNIDRAVARVPFSSTLSANAPVITSRFEALSRRVKIRISSAAALSISLRKLKMSYAYLGGAVKVLVVRMAGRLRRLDEPLAEWMYITGILHVQGPGP